MVHKPPRHLLHPFHLSCSSFFPTSNLFVFGRPSVIESCRFEPNLGSAPVRPNGDIYQPWHSKRPSRHLPARPGPARNPETSWSLPLRNCCLQVRGRPLPEAAPRQSVTLWASSENPSRRAICSSEPTVRREQGTVPSDTYCVLAPPARYVHTSRLPTPTFSVCTTTPHHNHLPPAEPQRLGAARTKWSGVFPSRCEAQGTDKTSGRSVWRCLSVFCVPSMLVIQSNQRAQQHLVWPCAHFLASHTPPADSATSLMHPHPLPLPPTKPPCHPCS
jgi:hypothetical protein